MALLAKRLKVNHLGFCADLKCIFFLDSYSSDEDDSDVSDQQKVLHTTEQKPTSTLAFTLNTSKLRIAMFPKTKVR